MTESILTRWSRRAAIVAGVSFPVLFTAALLAVALTGRMEGPPPDLGDPQVFGLVLTFSVPAAIMMLSIAGVSRRYGEDWRVLGRAGRALAIASLAVIPLAGVASMVGTPQDYDTTPYGSVGFVAAIVASITLGLGFVALGIAALRSSTPSRRFGLIAIGVGLFQPAILLVSVLRVFAYTLGWVALGLAIPSPSGTPAPQR